MGLEVTSSGEETQDNNVRVVQALYAAFGQGDIPTLLTLLAEDIDWLFGGPQVIPFAGHYQGRDAVAQFFDKALKSLDFAVFEPLEFIATRDIVLVQGRERAQAKTTGRAWQTDWAHIFTLRDGLIIKLREYYDTAVIASAFGNTSYEQADEHKPRP